MQNGFDIFKEAFVSMSLAVQCYNNIEDVEAQQFTDGEQCLQG